MFGKIVNLYHTEFIKNKFIIPPPSQKKNVEIIEIIRFLKISDIMNTKEVITIILIK